ncbi:hypothetical protein SELMODRAFT_415629 [Selaginella moellendorffii]|uniref:Mitochondrial carrier protein n=1 Tax=Selaginella moellendorffii TaxID=88036 RepID=D8RWR2_SELML|nr:solute carrier family 25 member 44 [Selaginella moellendorffii]XP_002978857.1 solute carrier family 25 member 44 [Selaginella moellendorffii]EFJ20304.1 hypothetical protein SELMODRAFT_444010 [Selaginella moellendorffii]EFJ23301.1 hypothetical protein SELMODRAFT_415629 [Selaginella moellendorffii]|eukprot:XP_002975672.1 solute carrier family 25 member 44 [Selaginella moellendorffii]
MSLRTSHSHDTELRLPADVDWYMLDKTKFFMLGAGLFSGVSAMLYPIVVIKTRQQVFPERSSSTSIARGILKHDGIRGFYRGFGTSLLGTIPARALYMSALEITKSNVAGGALQLGFSEPIAAAMANAAGGVSAAVAAQLVWTPVDVISQRLMVQGGRNGGGGSGGGGGKEEFPRYRGGFDAFRKILKSDGVKGLYRGFGMSVLTYAPSNAVWWASYCVTQRSIWSHLGYLGGAAEPTSAAVVCVQGISAAAAGGAAALVTTPLDTVKTRIQVLESDRRPPPSISQTLRVLVMEGGWRACYRGLGPRWASMSMSATTMITTYEFLKRMSAKKPQIECSPV